MIEYSIKDDGEATRRAAHLLILEDDDVFRERLARAMTKRGFVTSTAANIAEAEQIATDEALDFAVVDLRIGDEDGLDAVARLRSIAPRIRALILTGYGNIPTAVAAVKLGAVDYIAKPVTADEVVAALLTTNSGNPVMPQDIKEPDDAKLEHILHVFETCGHNVSETARQLGMHRRTLQRLLPRTRRQAELAELA